MFSNSSVRKLFPHPLVILLVAFGALAAFYSLVVPLFEGPDEDDHFRYAKFIADHRALPVQAFEPGGGAAGHQGWQPPLYYALVAALIAPLDTSDYAQHLWRNPAATFVGDPACCGRNLYYHTDSENFPFTRTTLAVHLARLLSICFGLITVAATYALTKTIVEFGGLQIANCELQIAHHASRIPLAAAALVAFNPSFLFASALVSNDAPLAAFSALVLLVWVRLLCGRSVIASGAKQSPNWKLEVGSWKLEIASSQKTLLAMTNAAALLGALLGLALLTKTTALGLIPFSVLVLVVVAWRQRDWRFAIVGNAVMLAIIALLAGWWFARNQVLYGDPLAYRLMLTSALFPRAGELTLPELFQISLPWLWQTFWGGPTPGDFAPALLFVLGALTLLAFVGMILFTIRNLQFAIRTALIVLAAWLAFILAAQIQFIRTTTGADQGRYLFPAISVFALFFVIGLNELAALLIRNSQLAIRNSQFATRNSQFATRNSQFATRNSQFAICHLLICSFFLLALFVPFGYTLPAYARPALLSENDLARVPNLRQVNFANRIELRGYALDTRAVKPGDALRVTLYWRALAPMSESYRVFAHLIGQNDRSAGGVDVIPARGAFPTVYWKPGDVLRDVVQIPVAPDAPAGKYAVEVGLYPLGQPGERLTVIETGEDRVWLDALKVAPRQPIAYTPQTRVHADFAGQVRLLGYDVRADLLTLYWECRAPFDRDYTVFVHVLDADGKILWQVDQQPQAGNYPTSLWAVGEQIPDQYELRVPAGAERLQVRIGLYRADTGERLPVEPRGDSVQFEIALPR